MGRIDMMGFLLFVTSKECKAEKWQINRPATPNGRIVLRSDATGGPGYCPAIAEQNWKLATEPSWR
jgi:hypothetical protein